MKKCYGKKKELRAETSACKEIFNKDVVSGPYNFRFQRRQSNAKVQKKVDKKISNNSLFSSLSYESIEDVWCFEPKRNIKKKLKKSTSKFKKQTNVTRGLKKNLDEFNNHEEISTSRESNLRGSIFGTSIKSAKKKSICSAKRKLRTRPIKEKVTPVKPKKGKKKKKSSLKCKKNTKQTDSYVEKINETLSKMGQYKLTIEHQKESEKQKYNTKKAAVENEKFDSSRLSNSNNFNLESTQSNASVEKKKYFTPTIRKKNISVFSQFLFSNSVHKKDKYRFHKKSHTTPSKCSKQLNKNFSNVDLAEVSNAEKTDFNILSHTIDSRNISLENKAVDYLKQNSRKNISPKILTKELRVVLHRLDLSKLTTQEIYQNLPTSQAKNVRRKGRKLKKVAPKKGKNKNKPKSDDHQKAIDIMPDLVPATNLQESLSKPIKKAKLSISKKKATKIKDVSKIKKIINTPFKLKGKKQSVKDKTDCTNLMTLKERKVNPRRFHESKLFWDNVDKSLPTTCASKLKKKEENLRIKKKPVKKGKNKKAIKDKKVLAAENMSMKPSKKLYVNLVRLDLVKLDNDGVYRLPQKEVIKKSKDKENIYPTSSEKSLTNPSLNQSDDLENTTIIRNKISSLSPKSIPGHQTNFLPTNQLARLNISKVLTDDVASKEEYQFPQKQLIENNKDEENHVSTYSHFPKNAHLTLEHSTDHQNVLLDRNIKSFYPPITSTPLTSQKYKIFRKQNLALQRFNQNSSVLSWNQEVTSNSVMISAKNCDLLSKSPTNKKLELSFEKSQEFSYEGFLTDKVNNISPKIVKSLNISKTDLLDKVYDRNILHKSHVSNNSYSNIEKSIFLKSHSSIEVSSENSNNELNYDPLLNFCNQSELLSFDAIYNWKTLTVQKVGEGSYGEVFLLKKKKNKAIIKVIPISREPGDNLQSVHSVYSEMKVCQCLNNLRENLTNKTRNFNLLRESWIVRGKIHSKLLKAWDDFSEIKTTYNERPDNYDNQQAFAIMELEYGGKDLSVFQLKNALEAESIFKQVAISLAIAEETHLFEHRDLHVGNILVQRSNCKRISYTLRGISVSFPSNGVIVNIIDFTLSRILDRDQVFYNNLATDEDLFKQTGDFQFEVYRATRDQLKNQWKECLLFSNVLWIQYLCKKLLEFTYLQPKSVMHKRSLQNLENFFKKLPNCKRALSIIKQCDIAQVEDQIDPKLAEKNANAKYVDKRSFMK